MGESDSEPGDDESWILAEAVARAWPDQPDGDEAAIGPELVDALRALDAASAQDSVHAQEQVLSILGRAPDLDGRVRAEIDALVLVGERGRRDGVRTSSRRSVVAVVYANERRLVTFDDAAPRYGGNRSGALRFGVARVDIPDDHRMGTLPNPRRWPLRFAVRRQKDYSISETEDFGSSLTEMRDRAPNQDMLVFVHGYNIGFVDAARRAAQLAYDLDFQGVTILYSWPSDGTTLSYISDGESAAASQRNFRMLLRDLVGSVAGSRVHVIAYSMGNRIVTEAITTIHEDGLGHVVFAAPDVDAQVFSDRAKDFKGAAERFTLYASGNDRALALSSRLAKFARAGSAGKDIVVVDGVDTVDATQLETDFVGHSYPMEHRAIVSDLYALIHHDHPPSERFGLELMVSPRGPYWIFRR